MKSNIISLSLLSVMLFGMTSPALADTDHTPPTTPRNFTLYSMDENSKVMVGWLASSDNTSIPTYHISLDGSNYFGADYFPVGDVLFFETRPLPKGIHTIAVRAEDDAGNVSESISTKFTINDQGLINELIVQDSPVMLEFVFYDAILLMTARSRSDLEDANSSTCELSTEAASSRVKEVLGRIEDVTLRTTIENFFACGTPASLRHGSGERLGIVNSYRTTFGHLPSTLDQWYDSLKIGNGRFPSELSLPAEARAKANFRKVYLREAVMNVAGDDNAITLMAYGIRPVSRNTESEASAIATYRSVYNRAPWSAGDWDIVRGIAYSSAGR